MRTASFQLETKMAYRTLVDNDISTRQVHVRIKNKLKWCWLDETETLPGGKCIQFKECFKKVSLSLTETAVWRHCLRPKKAPFGSFQR